MLRLAKYRNAARYVLSKSSFPMRGSSTHTTQSTELTPHDLQYVYRRILKIISSFRTRGHYASTLDPLREHKADQKRKKFGVGRPEFGLGRSGASTYTRDFLPDVVRFVKDFNVDPETGEVSGLDLSCFPDLHLIKNIDDNLDEKLFSLFDDLSIKEDPVDPDNTHQRYRMWSFNEAMVALARTYTGNVGVEYFHIENEVHRDWLESQVEGEMSADTSRWELAHPADQKRNLGYLMAADHTAKFLNKKYPGSKVFGIEGCEALLPGMWAILSRAAHKWDAEAIEMGMAHRGRMNILHNLLQKPLSALCTEFAEADQHYGDVKYHLGTRSIINVPDREGRARELYVSLAANPSHLEAVNPVVMGKTKAKQLYRNDVECNKVVPILLHGDASFSGQGVVPECLELTNCRDYNVGGCVHIIINNQIGFTTDPQDARASYHCTDSAKAVDAPIFHVNGDDVDAVVAVCELAIDYRMMFNRDVVVDIVCYRRHGHNEQDDPMITHPNMYQLIKNHPTTLDVYRDQLLASGAITQEYYDKMSQQIFDDYETDFLTAKEYTEDPLDWLQANWQGEAIGSMLSSRPFNRTGVRKSVLHQIGKALTYVPDDFVVHKDVEKILNARRKMLETEKGFTWAMAESLALGALLTKYSPEHGLGIFTGSEDSGVSGFDEWNTTQSEGEMVEHPTVYVRLSGQDCIRGTFNQRHSLIYDQKTSRSFSQLNNLGVGGGFDEQAEISVCNSPLSEFAVVGFEYGFSLSNEMSLTLFEAQFGDFANNAQCIIDNFIVSGEAKWNNRSSLVLLLPHGYDGNGPEHSSARLERFLSMVDDDCDAIPGKEDYTRAEIETGFNAFDQDGTGKLNKSELVTALQSFLGSDKAPDKASLEKAVGELMTDLKVRNDGQYTNVITKSMWYEIMSSWAMRYASRKHNLIVTMPSTPAQYFHVLRRQIHRPYAKPLVVMNAKWLLHHSACVSDMREMTIGSYFQRVITEGGRGDNIGHRMKSPLVADNQIKRVVFCSGKIFYHLFHAREVADQRDVTFVRLEQLAPFPYDLVLPVLRRYGNAEIVWVQEEPKNMGAYSYCKPRLETALRDIKKQDLGEFYYKLDEDEYKLRNVYFCGRGPSAAPANGGFKQHTTQQREILDRVLNVDERFDGTSSQARRGMITL
jgi:2-oxoglutarate dehydrogenase E1 component